MVKTGQNYRMMFFLIGKFTQMPFYSWKTGMKSFLDNFKTSEVGFGNGQNTEEENMEIKNSIKIKKGKICHVRYIPVLFQLAMK